MLSDSAYRRNMLPEALAYNIRFVIVETEDGQGWEYSFQLISALEHFNHPIIRGSIPKPVDKMRAIGIAWARVTAAMIDDPLTYEQSIFLKEKKRGDQHHE